MMTMVIVVMMIKVVIVWRVVVMIMMTKEMMVVSVKIWLLMLIRMDVVETVVTPVRKNGDVGDSSEQINNR